MPKGLSSGSAKSLLNKFGQNIIIEQKKSNILQKIFEQFNNFLTILLILAAIFSGVIGEAIDAFLIILIVLLNAAFGLYQELKAEESIEALRKIMVTKVRVIRDGIEQEIDSRYLVPGDIVFIEEGAKIPADGKIVEARNLEVNEAVLTGESLPVLKNAENKELYSGTIVAKGRGLMQIASTGMQTKFGQIAANLSEIEEGKTPLQRKLAELTKLIGGIGIVSAVIVFLLSILRGSTYFPAFLLSISLAVAVVPEGLPAVMTIILAIGMKKMAEKKAIIRKLSAVEALGSITLIATDKTGTLTENKMKVKEIYCDNKISNFKFLISKQFSNFQKPISKHDAFSLLLLDGILCSTASLVYVKDHDKFDVLGDPTEGALLYLAQQRDMDYEIVRREWKIIDEKPFDPVTKMMTVTVTRNFKSKIPSSKLIFTKGAPEGILASCQKILINGKEEKLTDVQKSEIEKQVDKWASQGLRVLAFAYSNRAIEQSNNLTFLGLVAIHDAPRPEVLEAVSRAKEAGIKVVMITGDNEKTAEAVGILTGIIKKGDEVVNGWQIDKFTDEELLNLIPKTKIFARTNPFQKHRLVKLYQKLGDIVAVTGDGLNDAIALKQADVGVAMGMVGTDVARETADMVITDDNFATIVTAVEEGRHIINNLKNAIKYLLSCNISEAISLTVGLFLNLSPLFLPIQILYINLVTDGIPALVLSFSPRSRRLMSIPPQKELELLKNYEKKYIIMVGFISSGIVLASYFIFVKLGFGQVAAFSVLTLIQSFIFIDLWLSHRSIHKHLFYLFSPLFILSFLVPFIFQFMIITHPIGAELFKVTQVNWQIYFEFVLISSLILPGIKVVKKILRID